MYFLAGTQIMRSYFPAASKILRASVNSYSVCVAVTMVRIRALPTGTVGNPMLMAKTPSSKS